MAAAIGQTASITLLTALPGSGKSLRLVKFVDEATKAGEQVYVCNLNGLNLPHMPWDDPTKWQELPPGSVLIVDEAQKWFKPTRDTPDWMREMSLIRHHGVRLVLATQQPEYLHKYVLGLVGLHEHLVRLNGQEASTIYRHNEIMERVRSKTARTEYDNEKWSFPKEYYNAYTSAQTHTVKYVMPSKFKRGLVMISIVAAILGYLGWSTYRDTFAPAVKEARGEAKPNDERALASEEAGEAMPQAPIKKVVTPAEYLDNMRPRVAALPYSSPLYDDRRPRSDPEIYCMSAASGLNGSGRRVSSSCTCITEQGTGYELPPGQCEYFAEHGSPYNPYRQSYAEKVGNIQGMNDDRAAMTSQSLPVDSASSSPQQVRVDAQGSAIRSAPTPVLPTPGQITPIQTHF